MHYVGIGPYKVLILNWNKRFLQAHARAGPHNSFGRIRPVTGWGEVVCTCWDIRSVNFFCFLKTSTSQLGMVEHLKVRQNCQKIENHYFQLKLKFVVNEIGICVKNCGKFVIYSGCTVNHNGLWPQSPLNVLVRYCTWCNKSAQLIGIAPQAQKIL